MFLRHACVMLSLLLACPSLLAAGASQQSVHELLTLTNTRALMSDTLVQVESQIRTEMNNSLRGVSTRPEANIAIERMQQDLVALLRETLSWEQFEPKILSIYQRSFTEAEVQGMIDFYSTPAGQAVISKMPLVMQHSMEMVWTQTQAMQPRLQEIQARLHSELQACCSEDTTDDTTP
ncbi:MAG: DUF2059 domain-containing protein [Pseudomonadota bacterium]|nr:DUF2059 domain-containing protein [Pseudomonadota bacterium]